jgi:Tol biopolymer transport system component
VDRVNATSVVIDGNDVSNADVTPDGRFVAFDAIPAGGGPRQVFLQDQTTGEVTLISANIAGAPGNGNSTNPSVSDNGAVVAFQSSAVDLGARSSSSNSVLVREVSTTSIRSASSSATGDDVSPAVSGDGNSVAFESRPVGGSGFSTVLVWSAGNGQLSTVSTPPSGDAPNGPSGSPSINQDGRFVAFESRATNIVGNTSPPLVLTGESNVFVRDLLTSLIAGASVPLVQGTPANGDSHNPSISEDGTTVAFDSTATNLTADVVPPGESNVFVRDLSTEATTLVTRPATEPPTPTTPPPPAVPATGATVPTTGTGAGLTTGTPVVPTGTGTGTGTTLPVVPTGTGTSTGTGTAVVPTGTATDAGTSVPTGTGTSLNTSPATVPTGNAAGLTNGTPVVSTGTGAGTTPVVPSTGTASGLTTGMPVVPTGTGGASAGTAVPTGTGTSTGGSLPVAPTPTGDQGGSTPVVLPGNGTGGTTSGGALVTSTPVTTTGSTSPFGPTTPVVSPIAPVTTVAALAAGSVRPGISSDGAWVVFESRGQNLTGVSTSSGTRIFIADLRSGTISEIR